ncbi:type II toxin-antitoxin system RelE/ParE family toxin [Maridesulfovibrio ferrireducens]|uniref:type II toxin-antitoxin system RelE/ParE family toxin n=1 Tax=Maridesulfovibrio ferrireducens TaxID=246191 RepID=UPI001A255FFD|nr:type II toxin-antitoxin system RelE/ParE family toxin [Maridesulfovibrio ferrireducens]MBI9110242.1 type II toxin-antitoxin system RelE/ParE family toxin [Maridesulfovibrio ferrireducens]
MIKSFKNRETEKLFKREYSGIIPNQLARTAYKKLIQIDSAHDLKDLKVPPGNRLELLKGNRAGQYSIRINNQYRICFVWDMDHASQVEVTDYHN